jgi:molybdopterin synthase catalytic subunit
MQFRFAHTAIDTAAARPGAGGYVCFEGWVRDHNEGQDVTRLEYEAFEALAVKEGERILAEASKRFPIKHALCIHRVGSLELTDLAVWVGVSAAHRGEAFDACRFIIDEVKHRLPIWKKEHYRGGDSGWVNCERCAAPEQAHDHAHDHGHHAA